MQRLALATLLFTLPAAAHATPVSLQSNGQHVTTTLLSRAQIDAFHGQKEDLVRATVDALQKKNSGGKKRGFHGAPALGIAKAELTPLPNVPARLATLMRQGIFGQSSKAVVRFSSGNPNAKPAPEWVPDVRGLGVLTENGNLTATNQPAQIVPRGIDFLNFFHGTAGPFGAPFRWSKISPRTALRGLGKLLIGTQPVPDLMRTRYWGYPTVIGADAHGNSLVARTVFTPVGTKVIGKGTFARIGQGALTLARNLLRPKFQSQGLANRLALHGAEFEVGVQLYRDEASTPLHLDGDKAWNVPVIPVATLRMPVQLRDAALYQAAEQAASFGPQETPTATHGRIANEAVGQFQTDRLAAYAVSAGNRGASEAGSQQALELVK
jgi:hypothetical protein